jgi:phosphoglycerate kinase
MIFIGGISMTPRSKLSIDDIDVRGKRVLVREDLNVPMRNGSILDDRRIREAVPTIEALRSRGARIIVVAHLGRPKGRIDESARLGPIAARLSSLLGADVQVASDVVGDSAQSMVASLHDDDIGMLENVRFEPGEEANDPSFAGQLAAFGDVFVNDAFGTAHRAHASTEGVAHLLPAVAGKLMARELEMLGGVMDNPRLPVVAIVGGSKISTKVGVLENLLDRVDVLWVGRDGVHLLSSARREHRHLPRRRRPGGHRAPPARYVRRTPSRSASAHRRADRATGRWRRADPSGRFGGDSRWLDGRGRRSGHR